MPILWYCQVTANRKTIHTILTRKGAGTHMERAYYSGLGKSLMNNLEYKRIEIPVNGKKVCAHFPKVGADSKIMPLIQEILISSYLNNVNKSGSFVGQSSAT